MTNEQDDLNITIPRADYNTLVEIAIAAEAYVKSGTPENWEQLVDAVLPDRTATE